MSLPRRSHMLGPVAYAERGRCALPLHIGLRAPGKEHGEIDLHHIGCSVASHAGSPAVQPQGPLRRVRPEARQVQPACSGRGPIYSFPVLLLMRPDAANVAPGSCLLSLR